MDQFLQHLLNGLVLGATYALLGIGLTLIFGIMKVVNMAHGELYTLGAYVAFGFVSLLGLNYFGSVLMAAAVVVNILLQVLIVRVYRSIPGVVALLAGLAIANVFVALLTRTRVDGEARALEFTG